MRQFALTAVKLQKCLAEKHVMSVTLLLEHGFVSRPLLDAIHSNFVIFTKGRMPDIFSLLFVCP